MPATRDIVATYRGPGKVVRRLLGEGVREDRALIYLMIGCLMVFVAQTPRLARQAFETGENLQMLMGASLMAWLFIAPLLLYAIGALTHLVARVLRARITSYGARLALFWALLASSPLVLLWGLTAGFIGQGIQLTAVGFVWFALFVWFWFAGFRAALNEDV
ncbi:YIP1 family protein [Sulfitobacter sp. M57]|uniref:YIP1 family protein n=1 Tax=unclassified Sulfitobacter TaxID=196795 RepID=UPI0023E17837|nr:MULTISPECIES: YIP1 family protein [unclassified Sulfitobacter]MDF3413832.1 YIP1 family protein [Sulfitobacter sp. KE5]MDF3420887.1 YIP1 family protein [Sulfitobacter sp. KE43]MDF3432378.1 YIP1 family protein [Sulfitobacter sp. KE42]MDF3458017.1 YIP1 family protein [Sulfitobacter sp. S74]MDF3461918.1 YIP1 family protein [Sulfitobacter sp. Ks18]